MLLIVLAASCGPQRPTEVGAPATSVVPPELVPGASPPPRPPLSPAVAAGFAESLVTVFFGFGCLTIAWLCVAFGMWRKA